jgi:hypothetical protein
MEPTPSWQYKKKNNNNKFEAFKGKSPIGATIIIPNNLLGRASHFIYPYFFGLWGYWHCGHSWPVVPASGDNEDDCGEADEM